MASQTSFLELRLYDNGIDFINKSMESFVKAIDGRKPVEYKYAILLLATGCELILKSILEDIHPFFIKENIDSSSDITVKAENLVSRINKVYGLTSSKRIQNLDENNLNSIREIRNQITHKEVVFKDEDVPQNIYARTLFSLDRIVIDFKGLTLSSQVNNWSYIVNVEPIQQAYYNSAKGIALNGILVPCPFCSIKKLVTKNNKVECLHCSNTFENIEEAINSLDDLDFVEELFNAFTIEKYKKGMHFMDCPLCEESDCAWYELKDRSIRCFKCGIVPSDQCSKCFNDSLITYHHHFKHGEEEVQYCFTCKENPEGAVCPNCKRDDYKLSESLKIDVIKPYKFYPNVTLEPSQTAFIEVTLCPGCYEKMEIYEKEGFIEII